MDEDRIRERLEERREELEDLKEREARSTGLDEPQSESSGELNSADDTDADHGTETFEREKSVSLIEGFDGRLRQVDRAMERLEEGAYGVCEVCGEEIAPERLEARPESTRCDVHREQAEKRASAGGP